MHGLATKYSARRLLRDVEGVSSETKFVNACKDGMCTSKVLHHFELGKVHSVTYLWDAEKQRGLSARQEGRFTSIVVHVKAARCVCLFDWCKGVKDFEEPWVALFHQFIVVLVCPKSAL